MHKILISKRSHKILKKNIQGVCYDLFDGFCMEIADIKPVKNFIGFTKYYRVYVYADHSTQKEVVKVFQWLGIIPYKS